MPGEQDPSQQDVSRFEAFKSTLSSAAESIKGKTAIALIGVVGLTGAAAIESQVSTEPANAANVPEATASDQTQDCVDTALGGLNIKWQARMVSPGDRRKQAVSTGATLEPLPSECLPLINRETPQIYFKMQRPKNHKQWIKSKSQSMQYNYEPIDGNVGGKGAVFVETDPGSPFRDSKFRYRCTPGKGITHVRAVYNLKVDSAVDGHTLGKRTLSVPVKIIPINPALPHPLGGGVRKAC